MVVTPPSTVRYWSTTSAGPGCAPCSAASARHRWLGGDPGGGADLKVIVGWITETTVIRTATQALLTVKPTANERMSEEQISEIVQGLGGLLKLLRQADPSDKAEIYSRLGLQLTYRPGTQTVIAEVVTSAIDGVNNMCPEIDTYRWPTGRQPIYDYCIVLTSREAAHPGGFPVVVYCGYGTDAYLE
ncbi:hypothetical protein ACFQS1_37720 [Paractinoplanes rhizophilus]|uniref:Uncharacterized protein n=1 Tax=Paractinoplanes rhizophilus TaxID=1416877 RepID=A0ABW2I4E2_9ACTN